MPSGLSNVVAVAAGAYHSLGLVSDGRPLIVQSPVGGTAFTGRDFAFKAQAVGNAPLVYQWTFNGTNLPTATNATLTVTNIQFANAGTYQLLVSNSVGTASSLMLPVNVINSAPFLTTQPASRTGYVGNYRVCLERAGQWFGAAETAMADRNESAGASSSLAKYTGRNE